jgi:hypothetical protein
VPVAAARTIVVNRLMTYINAAVVGNRYDVAQAVGHLRRLVGTRGVGVGGGDTSFPR